MSSSDSLKRFVLIAKGGRGAACKHAIQQALDSPDVHVFGELLALPSVKALAGTEHEPMLKLLQIFAYGTYTDYTATANLPELTAEMMLKLRLLTVVQMGTETKRLPYASLIAATQCASLRDLEDIVIEGICRKLFGGKLDQKLKQVKLTFVVGRDLKTGDLDYMITVMDNWCSNCEGLLADMMAKMNAADSAKKADKETEEKVVLEIKDTQAALQAAGKDGEGGGGKFDSSEFIEEASRDRSMGRRGKRHAGPRRPANRA